MKLRQTSRTPGSNTWIGDAPRGVALVSPEWMAYFDKEARRISAPRRPWWWWLAASVLASMAFAAGVVSYLATRGYPW